MTDIQLSATITGLDHRRVQLTDGDRTGHPEIVTLHVGDVDINLIDRIDDPDALDIVEGLSRQLYKLARVARQQRAARAETVEAAMAEREHENELRSGEKREPF